VKSNSLRIGIVGCGKIADGHVEEVAKISGANVVAVCDRELLMAERIAVRQGIDSHYDDFTQMLSNERLDVVHITTPPQSHLPLAREALESGCHVYVEKPFAMNVEDAQHIIECARSANRIVTIGHSFEFDPLSVRARDLIDSGAIGDVVHVESYLGYNIAGPFGAVLMAEPSHWVHDLPGKLFQNNINHVLHKVLEHVHDEKPVVRAIARRRSQTHFADVRDQLMEELRVIVAGKRTTGYATFSSNVSPVRHYSRIFGTRSTITLDYGLRTLVFDRAETLPSAIGRLLPPFAQSREHSREGFRNILRFARADFHFFAGMRALFERLYDAARAGGDPPIPYREILRITAVMDEIFVQIREDGDSP